MPAGSFESIAADTRFPRLIEAVSEPVVVALLRDCTGADIRGVTGIDVLNHKPGRRCTLRYRVETAAGDPSTVVAKWYRDLDEAAALHRRQAWLGAQAGPAGLTLAVVQGYDASRGVILQSHLNGRELRDRALSAGEEPFALAGEWLARLHCMAPSQDFETKDLAREVRKAAAWAAEVAEALPVLQSEVQHVVDVMSGLVPGLTGDAVIIHRDFYPANLLWDGEAVWGIDFDQAALGDAGVDLGAFVSQMEKLALRTGQAADAVDGRNRAFLGAYTSRRPLDLDVRLPFFRAYTLLHVASAEVRRRREGWESLSTAFVRRATEVLRAA